MLGIGNQIKEVSQQEPEPYVPFIGTLFIFIAVSNLLSIIPGYQPPTGSLSTTAALAICVFFAIPLYGIKKQGFWGYFKKYYLQPTPFMLPFNIIGRVSNTISLSVRLFGNVMSGTMIVAILLSIAPALGEGKVLAQALSAIAQQPDIAKDITRTLFVGMALVESTAIYCFVITLILIFANPFWAYFIEKAGG